MPVGKNPVLVMLVTKQNLKNHMEFHTAMTVVGKEALDAWLVHADDHTNHNSAANYKERTIVN